MNYVTGSQGFVGTNLLKKVDAQPIPHNAITITELRPFQNFYFLSTYGNMAFHDNTWETMKANIMDIIAVLERVKDMRFNSFVFMSTSSVKLRRQTTYSRAKRAAEEILLAYMERHNLPIAIVRPFSITGKGEQEQHLIPTLIRSCLHNEPMNFVPHPVHDYINVEDVVDGLINLSQHQARGIFELGTGTSYSNDQVRALVEKATKKKANIKLVSQMREYDSDTWESTNYKSRSYGWFPKKSLMDSIQEML